MRYFRGGYNAKHPTIYCRVTMMLQPQAGFSLGIELAIGSLKWWSTWKNVSIVSDACCTIVACFKIHANITSHNAYFGKRDLV
jgi:hypothetical protein